MSKKEVFLRPDQDYITLQAVLQITDVIPTGGAAKPFLQENTVLVNGEKEDRRGRKLYPNDIVQVGKDTVTIKKHDC